MSTEMQNCQNLPAIVGTERILDRLDRVERIMTERFENITARMSARQVLIILLTSFQTTNEFELATTIPLRELRTLS